MMARCLNGRYDSMAAWPVCRPGWILMVVSMCVANVYFIHERSTIKPLLCGGGGGGFSSLWVRLFSGMAMAGWGLRGNAVGGTLEVNGGWWYVLQQQGNPLGEFVQSFI